MAEVSSGNRKRLVGISPAAAMHQPGESVDARAHISVAQDQVNSRLEEAGS
jgi:hypothetical protein